jgi:predicted glutamine amidotransferase
VAPAEVLDAAMAMSHGKDAAHEYGPAKRANGDFLCHYDGWGAAYLDSTGRLRCMGGERPLADDPGALPLRAVATRALVVHARNATVKDTAGSRCTHPIARPLHGREVAFFHNGFAPDVHRLLGRPRCEWDTAELFEWLAPALERSPSRTALRARLEALPASTTSANFLLLAPDELLACNWFPPTSPAPQYYTMHLHDRGDLRVVSSEPVAKIAPAARWKPLSNQTLLSFRLDGR